MSNGIKVLVLNAPPMSGKDQIAKYFAEEYGAIHLEVKELLFQIAVRASGVSRPMWDAMYTREYKEIPSPYLMINGVNVSPRQWMIHCSETVIKPLFGKDAFGKAAVEDLINRKLRPNSVVVFSDGGFREEIGSLSDFAANEGGFYLARIHRDGYDWGSDSRNWLYLDNLQGKETDVKNEEGMLVQCAEQIWNWVIKEEDEDE